jgi:ankyrin repeat protein
MNELEKEFFELVRADDVFGLTAMLNEHPELANIKNEQGVPAILVAIYYDRRDVIALLIQSGATVDLCIAAALGDIKRLVKLLEKNPPLDAHSTDGWTALHMASYFGKKDAAKMLIEAGAPIRARSSNAMNNHPIHAAAAGKRPEIVDLLIAAGADVNATQAGGFTPLHAAAQNGDVDMAKALLAGGADANIRADNGQLPLDLALGQGHKPVVDILMEAPGIQ